MEKFLFHVLYLIPIYHFMINGTFTTVWRSRTYPITRYVYLYIHNVFIMQIYIANQSLL